MQKSHNAGTRTSRRATSAAKATLHSSGSPLSPFAFLYLSPSISVAIRAAHHAMAQLGHCQTKKWGGRGDGWEEWHHPLSLSPMRIRLPDTSVEPPTWLASSRWHHHPAGFPQRRRWHHLQWVNYLSRRCVIISFSSVLVGNDCRGWERCRK